MHCRLAVLLDPHSTGDQLSEFPLDTSGFHLPVGAFITLLRGVVVVAIDGSNEHSRYYICLIVAQFSPRLFFSLSFASVGFEFYECELSTEDYDYSGQRRLDCWAGTLCLVDYSA